MRKSDFPHTHSSRGRLFATAERQREANRELSTRLLCERLRRNGCSDAMVIAFTAARIDTIRSS